MREKTYKYSPNESGELNEQIEGSYIRFLQLERRNLLVVSFVLLFSFYTDINPEKGTFLGLSFGSFKESHYYLTLVFLLLYFLCAFVIYGLPQYKSALEKKTEIAGKAATISINVGWWHIEWSRLRLDIKYHSWLAFHYYLPVIAGLIALVLGGFKIV
ncbi:hypothetical protein TDB9533_04770 [Thalassocella blandensis]|nr:hypothetical protein TDB9533_04770 [Thalassocella blandensis]